MKVSVVIPWRARPELGQTLEKNARRLRRNDTEVLVVNGGGDGRQLDRLVKKHGWDGIRVIEIPANWEFNKSEHLNIGVSFSRGDSIFCLDTDVILTSDYLEKAIEELGREPCFTSVAKVIESAPEKAPDRWDPSSAIRQKTTTTELTTTNGRTATIEFRKDCAGSRTGAGLIVLEKANFLAVKGFNSALEGWGFEDFDLQIRLQLECGLKRRTFGEVLHLTHARPNDYSSNSRNRMLCYSNYDRGLFLGTYDADVEKWRESAEEKLY